MSTVQGPSTKTGLKNKRAALELSILSCCQLKLLFVPMLSVFTVCLPLSLSPTPLASVANQFTIAFRNSVAYFMNIFFGVRQLQRAQNKFAISVNHCECTQLLSKSNRCLCSLCLSALKLFTHNYVKGGGMNNNNKTKQIVGIFIDASQQKSEIFMAILRSLSTFRLLLWLLSCGRVNWAIAKVNKYIEPMERGRRRGGRLRLTARKKCAKYN